MMRSLLIAPSVNRSFGALSLTLLCTFKLTAAEYPVKQGNSELLLIEDPYVELQLKLDAIRNAKKSVKIISLSQGIDEGGIQMLDAIQHARESNKPKIQYIFDKTVSRVLFGDRRGKAVSELVDVNTPCPTGVICIGIKEKHKLGITSQDFFHQKIVIVDQGTSNERIFFGGRNNSEFDFNAEDIGFVLRPIDASKPHIGIDIVDYFDQLYGYLKKEVGEVPLLDQRKNSLLPKPPPLLTIDQQKEEYKRLKRTLRKFPAKQSKQQEFQFFPKSLQLLSNDTLLHAASSNRGHSLEERLENPNSINSKLENMIREAEKVTVIAYLFGFPPTLQEATNEMLQRGGNLQVWTNGRKAHRNIFLKDRVVRFFGRLLGVTASALDYTFDNFIPLLETARNSGGNARLYLRDFDQVRALQVGPQKQYGYQHTKAVIIDDRYVFTGSDNFTISSAARNDEFTLLIDSPKLARKIQGSLRAKKRMGIYADANSEEIQRQRREAPFISPCVQGFIRATF